MQALKVRHFCSFYNFIATYNLGYEWNGEHLGVDKEDPETLDHDENDQILR